MKLQKLYSLIRICIAVSLLAVVGLVVTVNVNLTLAWCFAGAAWLGFAALLVLTFGFFKCPNCKKRLDSRGALPEICPFCGETLKGE